MQRRPTPELLDTDSGTPPEIAGSIADLRFFNRRFGGINTTSSLIQSVAGKTGKSEFTLLEVASGDGYLSQEVSLSLRKVGIRLSITLSDRAPSHLPVFPNSNHSNSNHKNKLSSRAKPSDSQGESFGAVEGPAFAGSAVAADALALPFPDAAFDLVSCSLFVHHLSPDQVTTFARESLRVCRYAVLVNDLIRDPLHLALVYAGTPLYRSRITRHDAPASVRQAYTIEEMRNFFQQAGAATVEIQRHYLYRMGVIAWKKQAKGNPAT